MWNGFLFVLICLFLLHTAMMCNDWHRIRKFADQNVTQLIRSLRDIDDDDGLTGRLPGGLVGNIIRRSSHTTKFNLIFYSFIFFSLVIWLKSSNLQAIKKKRENRTKGQWYIKWNVNRIILLSWWWWSRVAKACTDYAGTRFDWKRNGIFGFECNLYPRADVRLHLRRCQIDSIWLPSRRRW